MNTALAHSPLLKFVTARLENESRAAVSEHRDRVKFVETEVPLRAQALEECGWREIKRLLRNKSEFPSEGVFLMTTTTDGGLWSEDRLNTAERCESNIANAAWTKAAASIIKKIESIGASAEVIEIDGGRQLHITLAR